jgi:hypothetical protein
LRRSNGALQSGVSLGQICHGKPTGGGKTNRKLVLTQAKVLYRYRRENPEFDCFVVEAIANSNSVGQTIRFSRQRARKYTARVREETNDYHKIRSMIPVYFPDPDEIVSRIFEDLLSDNLRREDVRTRVKHYINEHDRMFPTKYRKFGDSPLVSLDEALFDDRSTMRGDTVSRGLWD